eukprot:421646_1
MTSFAVRTFDRKKIGICVVAICASVPLIHRWYYSSKPYSSYTTSEEVMKGIDLNGKTAVITGCNTGIGKETAKHLLQHGCYIIMACRNIQKAETARDDIIQNVAQKNRIQIIELDLSSLKSINSFIANFKALNIQNVDYLINNAAVLHDTYVTTKDGFEIQFGVNYFGHFYLTQLLLPYIINCKGRIINLTSRVHAMLPYKLFEDFLKNTVNSTDRDKDMIIKHWLERNWNNTQFAMYGLSKALIILSTRELSKRFWNKYGVISCSVDPGLIKTQIDTKNIHNFGWFYYMGEMLRPLIGKSISQGAATTLRCVTMERDEIESGLYYANCNQAEHEVGEIGKPNEYIQDRLWNFTELLFQK